MQRRGSAVRSTDSDRRDNGKKAGDGKALKKDINKKLGTEKEFMLGNYQAYFSRHLLRLLKSAAQTAIWQHKRYRYQKGSDKPLKEDDHYPDATMLLLRKWMLGKAPGRLNTEDGRSDKKKKDDGSSTVTGGLIDEQF